MRHEKEASTAEPPKTSETTRPPDTAQKAAKASEATQRTTTAEAASQTTQTAETDEAGPWRPMKKAGKQIVFIALIAMAILFIRYFGKDFISFETVARNKEALIRLVEDQYLLSVLGFMAAFVPTAFFVPGAIVLSLAGGFLFGVIPGVIYLNIGGTLGAGLAFLSSRYLVGQWIQRRYSSALKTFNEEVVRHGHYYLISLRIVPVLPFFLVNYLAGLTKISLKKFIGTTSLGMLPGSFVYTLAGQQLETVNAPEDILSVRLIVAFSLLGLFSLLPVIVDYTKRWRNTSR
jgi:uncharacterized membrane protein YdjX (TVP38/TMEM64 family)